MPGGTSGFRQPGRTVRSWRPLSEYEGCVGALGTNKTSPWPARRGDQHREPPNILLIHCMDERGLLDGRRIHVDAVTNGMLAGDSHDEVCAKGNWSGRQDRVTRVSGGFGQPGAALGEGGEGCEEMDAVFGGGGEVAADGAELLGSGERPQAPGDLLPQFDHPDLAFGGVVVVIPTSYLV